jgi:hypothetical protein
VRICSTIAVLAACSLFDGCSAVQAQSYGATSPYGMSPSYSSMSGQMGMFGSRSLGSDVTAGQRSFGGGTFNTNGGLGGQGTGAARYLRTNRQPGEFVGADMQGMQRFVGAPQTGMGAGGWSQFGGMGPSMSGMGQNYLGPRSNTSQDQQREQGIATQNAGAIRTTFRVAFDCPEPAPNRISTLLARRLAELPLSQGHSPIQVEMQGRTAILRGVVTTEHDRGLVEQVVRLEPGIEAVKNDLAVASPTPAKSATP